MNKNADKEFKAKLAYYLNLSGYTKEELAILLNISPSTLYERIKDPGSFRMSEIEKMQAKLRIPQTEIMQMVFQAVIGLKNNLCNRLSNACRTTSVPICSL